MAHKPPPIHEQPTAEAWTHLISRQLKAMRYGTIQLTVHDGRVVQVDCTERTRLPVAPEQHNHTTN